MKPKLNNVTCSDATPVSSNLLLPVEWKKNIEMKMNNCCSFKKTLKSVHHYDIYYSKLEMFNK